MTRVIVAALITALIGGAAAWVTLAKEAPSKGSVDQQIDTKLAEYHRNDPYTADAKLLEFRLEQNTMELEKVKGSMDELKRDVGEIMGVLKALSSQIDDLSRRLPVRDDDG